MKYVVRLTADTYRFLKHFENGPLPLSKVQELEKAVGGSEGRKQRALVSLRYAIAIRESWLQPIPADARGPLTMQDTAALTDYGRQRLADDQPAE